MSSEQLYTNRVPASRSVGPSVEDMWQAVARLHGVPHGYTRLWRATGDGEEAARVIGSDFGNQLEGGIMVWYAAQRQRLVYVDVPTEKLNMETYGNYTTGVGGPGGEVFRLPDEVAQSAQPVHPHVSDNISVE